MENRGGNRRREKHVEYSNTICCGGPGCPIVPTNLLLLFHDKSKLLLFFITTLTRGTGPYCMELRMSVDASQIKTKEQYNKSFTIQNQSSDTKRTCKNRTTAAVPGFDLDRKHKSNNDFNIKNNIYTQFLQRPFHCTMYTSLSTKYKAHIHKQKYLKTFITLVCNLCTNGNARLSYTFQNVLHNLPSSVWSAGHAFYFEEICDKCFIP